MALKELAVQGMTLKFQNPAHSGTISVLSTPSIKVKVDGKGVYVTPLSVSISNGTDGTVYNATGAGTIAATAVYVKADGSLVMRKGDASAAITMTGIQTNPAPPPPTIPGVYTTVVEIDNPGQISVKGE